MFMFLRVYEQGEFLLSHNLFASPKQTINSIATFPEALSSAFENMTASQLELLKKW